MVSNLLKSPAFRESVTDLSVTNPLAFVGKRLFDLAFASLVTVCILSWMMPLFGLIIWLTSRGPAIFVQLRTGRHGRQFRCFKFRTMAYDRGADFRQATKNDLRITPIGRVLRKTNLDEMPQFLNVLLGEMSIVGPRPHPIQLDAQHWRTMPHYGERYHVKPGITGLAQVRGCRGETDTLQKMQHRLRFDRWYIRKQSPALDLQICWWTISRMINGDEKAH